MLLKAASTRRRIRPGEPRSAISAGLSRRTTRWRPAGGYRISQMKLLMQEFVWRRERLSACQVPQCISGQKFPALRDVLAPPPEVQHRPPELENTPLG